MAQKKQRVKKKKSIEEIRNQELILGAGFLALAILLFVSLISSNMGLFGRTAYSLLNFLFGRGKFFFPIFLAIGGLVFILRAHQSISRFIWSGVLIFLSLLTYFDTVALRDWTLESRIDRMALDSLDGGLVGDLLGSIFLRLLGTTGTKIILFFVLVLALGLMLSKDQRRALVQGSKKALSSIRSRLEDLPIQEGKDQAPPAGKAPARKKRPKKSQEERAPRLSEAGDPDLGEVEIRNYAKSSLDPAGQTLEKDQPLNRDKSAKDLEKASPLSQEEKENFAKEVKEARPQWTYGFPSLDLLNPAPKGSQISDDQIRRNGRIIEETLNNFNIDCRVTAINRGPVITSYEVQPAPGVRLNKIVSLADNLTMSLASSNLRIEAPIPGKSAVGIEVPNEVKDSVSVREVLESKAFRDLDSSLPLALGKDVTGNTMVSSIDKMPHLLIAGATGSGKSVCINVILTSILYKASPEEVRLILIDPKVVELNIYNKIPHLLIPVVTDPKKAAFALSWAVDEMEKRYKLFAEEGVRDIKGYNQKAKLEESGLESLAKIVVVVDELSDLMMVAAGEVEDYITRLAQMARAAGIYLIIATQRPSVDVITGTIKANIPSRIAFSVSSQIDSRTILDMGGAEKLLGKGDMLFYPGFYSKPKRIQGAFISDEEVMRVTDFVKDHTHKEDYDQEAMEAIETKTEMEISERDELLDEAIYIVISQDQASISFLQRKLKVGYARAARIVDQLEELGVIGPHQGSKPRQLMWSEEEIEAYLNKEVKS
ncbi:MAG: DNA translocase FtsK [Tissierellia bacterium]|nr:DNA translocase FtsK [Tissierellia bacterium]